MFLKFKNKNSKDHEQIVITRPKLGSKNSLKADSKNEKDLKIKLALLRQRRDVGLRNSREGQLIDYRSAFSSN